MIGTEHLFHTPITKVVTSKTRLRCYCVSDVHAEKNFEWIERRCYPLEALPSDFTVLIVPGDVATDIAVLKRAFELMVSRFDAVCFVPGNHELWRRRSNSSADGAVLAGNSIEKFVEVLECAVACGVYTTAIHVVSVDSPIHDEIDVTIESVPSDNINSIDVLVAPLYSWYHDAWDTDPHLTNVLAKTAFENCPFHKMWTDFSSCTWPAELVSAAELSEDGNDVSFKTANTNLIALYFSTFNESLLNTLTTLLTHESIGSGNVTASTTIISFSHFLPHVNLLPEKRFLVEPRLHGVSGSLYLQADIRRLQPTIHAFGHTHIPIDIQVEGTQFIQWPLGYAREGACRAIVDQGPLEIYTTCGGVGRTGLPSCRKSLESYWSKYYQHHCRQADVVEPLSTWLLDRLRSMV